VPTLNGGGMGIIGSHTGVERTHAGVGGGGAMNMNYHGVPLAALPEPIHRTVDFLLGVDRCTQLVDPAKLLEHHVMIPSTASRGGGGGWGGGGGVGSPGRSELGAGGGFHGMNGGGLNRGGFDRPFTEQAMRDGGGDALAPIRKNGTAGGAGAGGGEPLHVVGCVQVVNTIDPERLKAPGFNPWSLVIK
jgi:hypothetical protein